MLIRIIKKIIKYTIGINRINSIKKYLLFNGYTLNKPKVYTISHNGKQLSLSNTVDITHLDKVDFGDKVFIWHFTVLDSFNGIKIGKGCQIGTRVGIFTHSSHNSIRYYGDKYNEVYFDFHNGRIKGAVSIGDYTFIGANSIIMPKTKIGKGCIVAGFSYVSGEFSDYSIISGNPAKVVGDVRKIDYRFLKKNQELIENYLDAMNIESIEELIDFGSIKEREK